MNINLNNLNVTSSKQEFTKKSNDGKTGEFEKSLIDSMNNIGEIKNLKTNISKDQIFKIENDINPKISNIKTDIKTENNLCKNVLEIVEGEENIFKKEDSSESEEVLNLEIIFLVMDIVHDDVVLNDDKIEKPSSFSENIFERVSSNSDLKRSRVEKFLSDFFQSIGFDKNKIESNNITKDEVVKQIFANEKKFDKFIKTEILKIDKNFFVDDVKDDGKNILNDKQLFINVKNEVAHKINQNKYDQNKHNQTNEPKNIHIKEQLYDKITILNKPNNKILDDVQFLKEISMDKNVVERSIENYFVDTIRTSDVRMDDPIKTIDIKDSEKFVKEFIESINYMKTNNKTEMVVKLNPDHLGRMDIKYEFTKESVRVVMKVENRKALELIENKIADIKLIVKENNQINLENIHVELQQYNQNSNSGGGNGRNQNQNPNHDKEKMNLKIDDDGSEKDDNDLRSGVLV